MHVLPVLDIMRGQVVRGVAGQRQDYRPLVSTLANSAAPAAVAAAFRARFQLTLGYVADLDAIAGGPLSAPIYRQLLDAGFQFWLDAGVHNPARAQALASFTHQGQRLAGIVVGLESVPSPERLREIAAAIPPEQRVFSLDLRGGRPLAGPGWHGQGALEIADVAVAAGFARLIVLDLAFVGVAAGPGGETLCRVLHTRYPQVELISGGGVRHLDDLQRLAAAGCSAALVASALHSGDITREILQQLTSAGTPP